MIDNRAFCKCTVSYFTTFAGQKSKAFQNSQKKKKQENKEQIFLFPISSLQQVGTQNTSVLSQVFVSGFLWGNLSFSVIKSTLEFRSSPFKVITVVKLAFPKRLECVCVGGMVFKQTGDI